MLQVQIANRQKALPVARALWRRLLRSAVPPEWNKARLSVAVVGAAEMVELNRRFTGRSGDTDVLAFALGEEEVERAACNAPDPLVERAVPSALESTASRLGRPAPPLLIGEIVVCASRAQAEARGRGVRSEEELALYVVHGFLHLLGYDDHAPEDRKRMYGAEERLLKAAGVPYVRRRRRKKASGGKRKGR